MSKLTKRRLNKGDGYKAFYLEGGFPYKFNYTSSLDLETQIFSNLSGEGNFKILACREYILGLILCQEFVILDITIKYDTKTHDFNYSFITRMAFD